MEGALAPWHIVVLAVVMLVLFGGNRLPEAARALGQSLRIFKAETRALREDSEGPVGPSAQPLAPAEPEGHLDGEAG